MRVAGQASRTKGFCGCFGFIGCFGSLLDPARVPLLHEPGRTFLVLWERPGMPLVASRAVVNKTGSSRVRVGNFRRGGETASSWRPERTASGRHPEQRGSIDASDEMNASDLLHAPRRLPCSTSRGNCGSSGNSEDCVERRARDGRSEPREQWEQREQPGRGLTRTLPRTHADCSVWRDNSNLDEPG